MLQNPKAGTIFDLVEHQKATIFRQQMAIGVMIVSVTVSSLSLRSANKQLRADREQLSADIDQMRACGEVIMRAHGAVDHEEIKGYRRLKTPADQACYQITDGSRPPVCTVAK